MTDWWIPTGCTSSDVICAYKAVGVENIAASYVNLNNPGTNNATPGSGSYQPPTWDSTNGWKFNGTDEQQYLDTGATPSHEWTFIIKYVCGSTSSWDSLCGVYNDDNAAYFSALLYNSGEKMATYYFGSSSRVVSADRTSGILAIAGDNAYFNGALDGNAATVGTWTNAGATFTIGTQNIGNAGSEGIFGGINASVQCFVLYNKTLSGSQISQLTSIIQGGYVFIAASTPIRKSRFVQL